MNAQAITETIVAGGWNDSRVIRRGQALRLTDVEGGGNVSALFYNAVDYTERFNLGDTLKIQHICRLAEHDCIYSDMGRILLSIVASSCPWHDVLCGCAHPALIRERFGEKNYQDARNDFYRNGYESLLVELGKHGMTRRDFTETINFFSKVTVDDHGAMTYVTDHSKPGDFVTLRAEMDTLVVLDTGMHPLNPTTEYPRKLIKVEVLACAPAAKDDPCRVKCAENERGFINTEFYHL